MECFFLPNGSWCKPYKQTNALLSHEQLHFDIEELFSRKLLAVLKTKNYTANYIIEVKHVYDSIAKEANDLQKKYDKETNHFEIIKEQLRWEKSVHEQLQKTKTL